MLFEVSYKYMLLPPTNLPYVFMFDILFAISIIKTIANNIYPHIGLNLFFNSSEGPKDFNIMFTNGFIIFYKKI